jgi:hypothetical protein
VVRTTKHLEFVLKKIACEYERKKKVIAYL